MTPSHDALKAELAELIAIPSVSADPAHQADVVAAAEWVAAGVRTAGGDAEVVDWAGKPLAIGEVRASRDADTAPTILCYGHFDVQPPDPLELWDSDPFTLDERDGYLYARGICDDKGQLFMLLKAAELLATAGDLPVNLRFACDGEEEIGGRLDRPLDRRRRAWRRRGDRVRRRDGRARRPGVRDRRARALLLPRHA